MLLTDTLWLHDTIHSVRHLQITLCDTQHTVQRDTLHLTDTLQRTLAHTLSPTPREPPFLLAIALVLALAVMARRIIKN